MWGESGCAVPSLGLGGQQQVRQEWTPRAACLWAWGRQVDCSLWAVGCRGSPGAQWGSVSVYSLHCISGAGHWW
ncbi:hypothetical protein Nmel_017231, partial [Mimus melanotis]